MPVTVEIRNNVIVGIPHTFIVLTDSNGVEHGFGLAPAVEGSANGPGRIYDDTGHVYTSASDPIELTQDQYSRLFEYIQNSIDNPPYYQVALGSMCTVWAINALIVADGSNWVPGQPDWTRNGFWHDLKETLLWNPITLELKINISRNFRNGITLPTSQGTISWGCLIDPLAIDLDGDGIETVGIGAGPVAFDHDGDGIRSATGWLAPDDAWLVLDRNGNGVIDSGAELFGENTPLTVGTNPEMAKDVRSV